MVEEKGGNTVSGIIAFLATPIGRWAAISAMVWAVWYGFASHYETKGASRVVAKLEKTDNAVAKNIRSADHKSRNANAGMLDPNTVSE